MKTKRIILLILPLLFLFNFCKKKEEIDKEKPTIDLTQQDAFPNNCDTLYFGETVYFKALFKDNQELGAKASFSIDIHNNFDHHSHSTEVTECNFDHKKQAINPFTHIQSYDIPEGLDRYNVNLAIKIPKSNTKGVLEEGDYHFFINLTDKQGWSAQKGLNIKILHR